MAVVRIICTDLDCWEEISFKSELAAEIYEHNANRYFASLWKYNPETYLMVAVKARTQEGKSNSELESV